jgi:sporulation protein YlmC with PRC-barrel domain
MKKNDLISVKEILEKRVIDNKGTLIGAIKDIELSLAGQINASIETKTGDLIEMPFSDIGSVMDFVLLKDTTNITIKRKKQSKKVSNRTIVCDKCGIKAPDIAKFCPKCGNKIKNI